MQLATTTHNCLHNHPTSELFIEQPNWRHFFSTRHLFAPTISPQSSACPLQLTIDLITQCPSQLHQLAALLISYMHHLVDQVPSTSMCLPHTDVLAHVMSRCPWPKHVASSHYQVKLHNNESWHYAHCCSFLVHRALCPCVVRRHQV